jgi:hypothetical protein
MKNGKKLSRKEKIAVKAAGLNPENWLKYKKDNEQLHLVHRYTNTTRSIFL